MFNREQAIADWRRQMAAGASPSGAVLDELEDHLREEVRTLVSAGMAEREAFQLAVSHLGKAESMRAEFEMAGSFATSRAGRLWRWAGAVLVLGIALLTTLDSARPGALLVAHTLTLTAGYLAAFLAGGLGLCYFSCRTLGKPTPTGQRAFSRTAISLSQASVWLVASGLLFGMIWSAKHRGEWLAGDPRETGTLCVLVWAVTLRWLQRTGRVSTHVVMLLCVAGNIVLSLAWFGAGLMAHGSGIASSWVLNAVLGVNLLFLALGALGRSDAATKWRAYV